MMLLTHQKRCQSIGYLKKLNIKIDDNLAEEVGKKLAKIYDPDFFKEC